MEKLYKINEIAELLSVHPNTVRRWIKDNNLKTTKLQVGTERVTESELKRFVGMEGAKKDGK